MVSHRNPAVSVVMACRDAERYLSKAIASILHGSLSNIEFLIVDDGSSDSTGEILRNWGMRDSRVRLVKHSGVGLTSSLNAAIKHARAPYIARMDSDDIALPSRLKTQIAMLEDDPRLVCLGSEVLMIDPEGWAIGLRGTPIEHQAIEQELLRGNGGAMTHPAVVFRRSAYEQVGGYDERFVTTQDLDLFLKLAEIGRLRNLEVPLLRWRQHFASVNHQHHATWRDMKRMALEAASRRRGDPSLLNSFSIAIDGNKFSAQARLTWANRALDAGYFHTSIKHAIIGMMSTQDNAAFREVFERAFRASFGPRRNWKRVAQLFARLIR